MSQIAMMIGAIVILAGCTVGIVSMLRNAGEAIIAALEGKSIIVVSVPQMRSIARRMRIVRPVVQPLPLRAAA